LRRLEAAFLRNEAARLAGLSVFMPNAEIERATSCTGLGVGTGGGGGGARPPPPPAPARGVGR
jgi:hypothetical protein